ncbi:NUDIX hydrolase [Mangrovibacterium diazotrophicum]|uniref:ADP-ribose pyrophosphatase YjhB (NUDIX family) n=1 Tax=Mangrovibacterium diazotrophicum TaxID=1261403 RepID=A0A419VVG4_9BACT|nr:CoA pyrophosphatase [Mangrovibacterium diazotrophicum]RKD86160.1 ADP-ribose pyrophosphatase YjhB (NUDIX family) [Mangrovibacterium diazotrophicum]
MHDFSPENIARLLRAGLPGKKSHLKMIPPGRELAVSESETDQVRNSSVLLLLFQHEGKLHTCLTKRATGMKNHPGQISLPGGRIEEGEKPEVTALREAQEEVGIDPADVLLLGRLSDLYVQVSRFKIFPFVGWLDYKPEFQINVAEAEKVILFPIQEFFEEKRLKYFPVQTSTGLLDVPCFQFDGEIIWGATAMILSEFLDVLKYPQFTMSQ